MDDLQQHFNESSECNKCICKYCNKILSSARKFNLKAHLKNKHNIEIINRKTNPSRIEKINKVKEKIEINKTEVIRSFVGLVTEDGVPFNLLNSENMKNLLKPITDALSVANENIFTLNSQNAKKILSSVVTKLREQIKTELKNRLFSIKIDSATRLERCIFGISVQYCNEEQVVSRIIGMLELKGKGCSKSLNLSSEILKALNKYDVSLNQVIAVTSDNGANMLKATSLLSKYIAKYNEEDQLLDNYDYEQLLEEIATDTDIPFGEITICRCAAHTAQLVAVDVIKHENIKPFIIKCRDLTKFLRKTTNGYRGLFEANGLHIPQIDCPTRWGSSYKMIMDLKLSKEILTAQSQFLEVDDLFWEQVNDFLKAFSPLNDILIQFQAETLNYGDFYTKWIKCQLLIQQNIQESADGTFAKKLIVSLDNSMKNRSKKLLDNEILKSCLYLDPRFQHTLTATDKELAITYLKKIWDRNAALNKNEINSNEDNFEENVIEDEDIVTIFLKKGLVEDYGGIMNAYTKIEQLRLPFQRSSIDVLKYWHDRKQTDPELYLLASIVFGVPPTQVTIERAFSALRNILTESRNRLSEENLENILLAKLIPGLLDKAIQEIE